MPSFEEIQKARILNSFNTDEGLSELTKAEIEGLAAIADNKKRKKRALLMEKLQILGDVNPANYGEKSKFDLIFSTSLA